VWAYNYSTELFLNKNHVSRGHKYFPSPLFQDLGKFTKKLVGGVENICVSQESNRYF